MHTEIAGPLDRNPEDEDPPHARETPVAPLRAGGLMESEGQATEQAPSTLWSGIDLATVRPHMIRVAAEVLTGKQLETFLAWMSGEAVTSIAERLGITHQSVSEHLYGKQRQGRTHGGAFKHLRARLIDDDAFLLDVALARADRTIPDPGAVVREWFRGVRFSTLSHFVPLAALLAMFYAADAGGRLSFSDAYAVIPPAVVSSAIPTLKALGYVETDGVTIKIRRTPIAEVSIKERS